MTGVINEIPLTLTWQMFAIVCPLVFLAGFVDSIGGGGGLISLPAYILAGLPSHLAIGTNKLSSACGTCVSVFRFIREKLVNWRLGVVTIAAAIAGSFVGARVSLYTDENILKYVMIPVLCIAAFFVLNRRLFGNADKESDEITGRTYVIAVIASLVIGFYDGFYGPGTGTFLIICLNVFGHLSVKKANAQSKIINLTTNLTSLTVFILGGQVMWAIGLAGAVCNMLGNYLGSKLAITKGAKITRPIIITVLVILAVKILFID